MFIFHITFKLLDKTITKILIVKQLSKMIHECNYCNYQSSYKSNLKTHVKNKHSEKISTEKENGKPMKNDHHKQLKKIEMMMKNNFHLFGNKNEDGVNLFLI